MTAITSPNNNNAKDLKFSETNTKTLYKDRLNDDYD